FLHGILLFKTDFELWSFNRSGAYSSGLLSLKDNKEKLVRAISSYLSMSDQELGIDSTISFNMEDLLYHFMMRSLK
ncbi:Bgt-51471, partial [Blumeria graminis f. sp. tritici]